MTDYRTVRLYDAWLCVNHHRRRIGKLNAVEIIQCCCVKRASELQSTHIEDFFVVTWDFNQVNMKSILPHFHCFECTDWDMFKAAATYKDHINIDEYAMSVSAYINKIQFELCHQTSKACSQSRNPNLP